MSLKEQSRFMDDYGNGVTTRKEGHNIVVYDGNKPVGWHHEISCDYAYSNASEQARKLSEKRRA